jgi:hypothetical protein
MIVRCGWVVKVSIHEGMLIEAGSLWEKNVITYIFIIRNARITTSALQVHNSKAH